MPPSTERPSPVPRTALTPSVEGYLSAIYALADGDAAVGTQAIAAELVIAAPSVTEMLRRLDAHGLVEYRRGSGARLTRSGVLVARRQERRRAVIESFITTTIGLPPEEAAEEARTLEHHLSDRMVARIGEIVGEAPGARCRRGGRVERPTGAGRAAVAALRDRKWGLGDGLRLGMSSRLPASPAPSHG